MLPAFLGEGGIGGVAMMCVAVCVAGGLATGCSPHGMRWFLQNGGHS